MLKDFKVKRVRNNDLPYGPVFHTVHGMWLWHDQPNSVWYVRPSTPTNVYDRQSRKITETGDVPRKFKDKITLVFPGNRSLRLWKYLPFYTFKSDTRYSCIPPSRQGEPSPCAPPGSQLYYAYATVDNEWASRMTDKKWPLRAEFTVNPYGDYDSPASESAPTPFFEWCENLNLTYLVKKGIAALDSALSNFPDMLVVLAELGELADLFKIPSSKSDAYLQNQFGVQPTIGAVRDVAIGIAHRWNNVFGPKKFVVKMKVGGIAEKRESAVHKVYDCCSGVGDLCPRGGRNECSSDVSGVVTLEVIYSYAPPDWGSTIMNMLDQFLTRVNAVGDLSTLVELIPFSWMVDWFIPISTIAAAASVRAGIGKYQGLVLHMAYLSFRRVSTDVHVGGMYPCMSGITTKTDVTDQYVRVPLKNPWDWLSLAVDSSSVPHSLSQFLTVAAIGSK